MEIKEILEKHEKWLKGEEGGERADFSGTDLCEVNFYGANLRRADFSEADLSRANLSEANLSGAILSRANLSGAVLYKAYLRRADLTIVDFSGANLSEVNLSRANLSGANLSGANLYKADFSEAILREVNFSGATNILSPIKYIKDNFETTDEGIIAYKIFGSQYEPPTEWIIQSGSIITENCNMNRSDECGCGINVAPIEWIRRNYIGDIWKVLIRWEWLCGICVPYNTDGKIRCEMVELVEAVERNFTLKWQG